jgi:putative DNA-invertase from lambdoid prophage Rac
VAIVGRIRTIAGTTRWRSQLDGSRISPRLISITYSFLIYFKRYFGPYCVKHLRGGICKTRLRVLDMAQNREIRRVALYCRVSTGGQSTAMQAEELRRMAEARGWEVATVVEEKISGRKTRPGRERLIAEAKAGKYDAVMVWKLDRWGRSTADLVSSIKDLDESGVTFVSLKDGIDLSTSAGRLIANVLASIAEFEADGIRERVTAGVRHAQRHGTKSGKAIGRPATAASRAVEIRALRSQGLSLPAIVAKTGLSYGSVHRLSQGSTARHK